MDNSMRRGQDFALQNLTVFLKLCLILLSGFPFFLVGVVISVSARLLLTK